jgi:transcriptional regulator with XRE-family HTH domain
MASGGSDGSVRVTPQGRLRLEARIREVIYERRLQRTNCSQEDLADEAGVSIDTWKRFKGCKSVRRDSAELIARSLQLDLADLIESSRDQRPLDYYVERQPLESECHKAIIFSQSGALIRVKAAHRMGKTWFVQHLLNQVQEQQYRSVTLDFRDFVDADFKDFQTFLKQFCREISDSLDDVSDQVEERWQDSLGNNRNCTNYFETHLFAGLDTPLVLVLDNVDLVFEHRTIADNFCTLLRSWHDKASRDPSSIWYNLRLVIVHSTDNYGSLNINSSPLNVGTVFRLRKFNLNEAMELVQQYDLQWQADQVEQMMALTGGNPYLIHEALEYLRQHSEITLEQFLHYAPTAISPYHNYLQDLSSTLQQNSRLTAIVRNIVNSTTPIEVESADMFKLYSMGLVEMAGAGEVVPSCELYRRFFTIFYQIDPM